MSFFIIKRMEEPPLGLDNRDDPLFYPLFADLNGVSLFEWYQGLGEVESSSFPDW
jgi:hypothetical protein